MSTHRAISAYNFVVGIVLFGILRIAGRLRKDKVVELNNSSFSMAFSQATEKMGSDWIHHGEESYPEAAWLQLEVFHLDNYCSFYPIKNLSFETHQQNHKELSVELIKVI